MLVLPEPAAQPMSLDDAIKEIRAFHEERERERREEALIDEVTKYLDGQPAARRIIAKELIAMVRAASE